MVSSPLPLYPFLLILLAIIIYFKAIFYETYKGNNGKIKIEILYMCVYICMCTCMCVFMCMCVCVYSRVQSQVSSSFIQQYSLRQVSH